ncbi:hypothetical protein K7X08_016001 [Anisodus acutangulus]|uniref:Uncharacterized protein n=1 Tax=Anisodus acutangulus TaxID=402998 RepID=A0A9Q1LCI6_9SOLA|nr:hypothetical protein K7X08_016001 [Anisodus acutangulus]
MNENNHFSVGSSSRSDNGRQGGGSYSSGNNYSTSSSEGNIYAGHSSGGNPSGVVTEDSEEEGEVVDYIDMDVDDVETSDFEE